jgi:hypothetical protein
MPAQTQANHPNVARQKKRPTLIQKSQASHTYKKSKSKKQKPKMKNEKNQFPM